MQGIRSFSKNLPVCKSYQVVQDGKAMKSQKKTFGFALVTTLENCATKLNQLVCHIGITFSTNLSMQTWKFRQNLVQGEYYCGNYPAFLRASFVAVSTL